MSYTKKRIEKLCEKYDYCFYDYFIDDMYRDNKYFIKNWWTGDFKGFDRLEDIYWYLTGGNGYDLPVDQRQRFVRL